MHCLELVYFPCDHQAIFTSISWGKLCIVKSNTIEPNPTAHTEEVRIWYGFIHNNPARGCGNEVQNNQPPQATSPRHRKINKSNLTSFSTWRRRLGLFRDDEKIKGFNHPNPGIWRPNIDRYENFKLSASQRCFAYARTGFNHVRGAHTKMRM